MGRKQRKATLQAKTPKPERSDNLTFADHVKELRWRALWIALVFVVASSLAYSYHDELVRIVMAPLQGQKLIYLTPGGGFAFIFQITMYAGLIAAGPTLMYQVYGFLRPALPMYAKRSAVKVAFFATLLMVAGVLYGYFVAVPSALTFLSTFAGAEVTPSLTADSYLNFFLAYVGGLALLFQLPLLLIFWHWIKPMSPGGLLKSERFIILFAFIAAALITPTPDVVNQSMIAIPLIAIYQIGVVAVLVAIHRSRRRQKTVKQSVQEPAPAMPAVQAVPRPQPVAIATPAPAAVPAVTKQPLRRSIDGFSRPLGNVPSRPRPTRPIAVPTRSSLPRGPILRIDGMSPL